MQSTKSLAVEQHSELPLAVEPDGPWVAAPEFRGKSKTHPPQLTHGTAAQLHPKEHGAYAMLSVPIVTALIAGGPSRVGVCVAVAGVAGFLAHEPLLVLCGHRGRRAQRQTDGASSRLVVWVLLAIAAGSAALVTGSLPVRLSLLACLALAASGFAIALSGRHRTMGGQLWGAIGLSSPSVPILIAGGASVADAMTLWTAWLLGFWATTVAVRSVIAAQKRRPRLLHTSILTTVTLPVGIAMAMGNLWPLVTLPMIALSWYLHISPPPAKQIKRVGWTLVAGTLLSALSAIIIF